MDEQHILERISALVGEEQALREKAPSSSPDYEHSPEHARLKRIEEYLDQCWDLLRQRRAKREFGEDPAAAEVRDPKVVESYRG